MWSHFEVSHNQWDFTAEHLTSCRLVAVGCIKWGKLQQKFPPSVFGIFYGLLNLIIAFNPMILTGFIPFKQITLLLLFGVPFWSLVIKIQFKYICNIFIYKYIFIYLIYIFIDMFDIVITNKKSFARWVLLVWCVSQQIHVSNENDY